MSFFFFSTETENGGEEKKKKEKRKKKKENRTERLSARGCAGLLSIDPGCCLTYVHVMYGVCMEYVRSTEYSFNPAYIHIHIHTHIDMH